MPYSHDEGGYDEGPTCYVCDGVLPQGARYCPPPCGAGPQNPREREDAADRCLCDTAICRCNIDEVTGERERTAAEERDHEVEMERWERRYDELNGAPDGPEDY